MHNAHMLLLQLLAFSVDIIIAESNPTELCKGGISSEGLPGGIPATLFDLVLNGPSEIIFGCDDNEKPNFTKDDIHYNLYTRINPTTPTLLTSNNSHILNTTKPTKIIIAGYPCNALEPIVTSLQKAYLQRYDCNVIAIEYLKLSYVPFTKAVCNGIIAADMIASFLCELATKVYLDFSKIHILSGSFGAHLAGNIGANVQKICNKKIDRITGLDPDGPIYQFWNASRRLDKSDAVFVDVVHSNMGLFGYYGTLGHVDFFLNCGIVQPQCLPPTNTSVSTIAGITKATMCSHKAGTRLFLQTILDSSKIYQGESCALCPENLLEGKCVSDIINPQFNRLGEDCYRNLTSSKFKVIYLDPLP